MGNIVKPLSDCNIVNQDLPNIMPTTCNLNALVQTVNGAAVLCLVLRTGCSLEGLANGIVNNDSIVTSLAYIMAGCAIVDAVAIMYQAFVEYPFSPDAGEHGRVHAMRSTPFLDGAEGPPLAAAATYYTPARKLTLSSSQPRRKFGMRPSHRLGYRQPGSKLLAEASKVKPGKKAALLIPSRSRTVLDAAGIFYSTQTGNTEVVAGYIAEAAGLEPQLIDEQAEASLEECDGLIIGAPTWLTGADTERSGTDWDEWLYNKVPNMDLKGKTVAIFGVGDQVGYAENFNDAAGELYDVFTAAGCKVIGFTSQDGYEHEDSKAIRDGKFVGLMCDEDNQYDLSEGRAKNWIEQLKSEGFPF